MLEVAIVSLTTFFATIGPIDVAAIFASLTARSTAAARRSIALRGVLLAGAILMGFALLGEAVLHSLGISLPAFRTAGGILLLLIGIEMVFARSSGATSTTDDEIHEAEVRTDIAVFPLATPLLAGPGAISAVILLMADAGEDIQRQLVVCGSLLAVLGFTLLSLVAAGQLMRILGTTGMLVISRVFGILLTALAVQFVFDGIAESGLLSLAR